MAKPPAYDPLSPENYNPREAAKRAPAFAAPTTPSGTVSAPTPVVPAAPPVSTGAGFTPGSPFFPYTQLTYDTPAGPGLGRARFNPELMSKAFTATDKMPPAQQLAAREEIYKAYTGRPPPVTTEEIRDIQQPGWLDSLVGMLEPFALPQRGLYNITALATSSLLPDVGTPAGDTLEGLAGAFTSAGAYLPQNILLNLGLPSEERTSAFAEVGRNVYKAAANDDLLLEWSKTPGYALKSLPIPGGGTENDLAVTAPSFESIMNRVVPKELAARLESSAGNPAERAYFRALQSDLGRAVVGLAGELVTDPLLVTGPSRSASKIFKIMESEYRLNRVGVQAAEAIATKTGLSFDEAAKAVIKASGEAGDEARLVSRQMLLDAETDALARAARAQADAAALRAEKANPLKALQPMLDDMERTYGALKELAKTDRAAAAALPAAEEAMLAARRRVAQVAANPAQAGANVEGLIKGHERTAAAQRAYADAARRVLTAADDQKLVRAPLFGKGATKGQTGIVTKGTGFEMGLPFSDQTYSLTSKTLLPVTKLAGKALKSYSLPELSKKIELARQANESAYNVLTPGETAAYLTQNLLRNYVGVPLMHVHDYIGRTFGTRQWKPMLSKLSVFNKPGTKGGFDDLIPLSRIIDNEWVQLADTNPEVWQAYQSAVERFFQKTAANEQRLNQVITSIMEQAQALAKVRKVNAKAGKYSPELNARYLDRDYTGDSVFQEVAGAVETSADVLTPGTSRYRPDLANLEPQVRALRDDIVRTFGKDHAEVTQSLVAMARSLRGSAGFDDAVRQGLEETEQLAAQLARRESRAMGALNNYLPMAGVRNGWLLRGLDELDPTKLANTLDRMLVKSGGRAITPDLLRTAVLSAVKGDAALAQDILRRIALGFNKSAPADGVNVLAGMLTGKLAGSPSMTVEQALIDIVNEATDIARLSKAFREGTLKMDEVDTLAALAKQTTRIEIAQARALLGDKAFETALTMMDQLDQPNLAEALSKATNRKVADMEAGLSALLRARKGTDTLAVLAKGRADTISQTLIDLNLPPAAIAQLMERSDEGLTNLRLVQTILSTPNAEQALYDRMRLAALGGNNKGQLDAASEAAFRTAAANIVAAAQRANQPMNLPEEQVVKMAADGLRIAQEELDLVKNALAQLDATKPAKVTFTKAEQAAIAAAEANVEKAKQALEAAKAKPKPKGRTKAVVQRELAPIEKRIAELDASVKKGLTLGQTETDELAQLRDMRQALQDELKPGKAAVAGGPPAPPTPEELALLEAERALKAAREAATEAATLRSTAKKRALLQADITRKQQNLRDAQDAVQVANQQYATAALQFEDLMRTYLTDAVGAEQDALRALAATYKEDKIVASARQTLQEVAAGKAQLKDVEGVLRDALGDYGLQVARSIAQGARLTEEAPLKVTNVFYVAAKDLANVTADALREGKLTTSPVPQKGFALVALTPDDTLSIGAVRTSAGTKSAKAEAALDWVTFNPPVEKTTGKIKYRQLEAWESVLWSRFRGLTQGLSEEQRTEAAFLALRGAQQKGSLKAIDGVTFQELGERYGDIDPDIRPMVEELDGLLRSYEKMFKAHGLDFMADPLRMLKDWGVPSYVPHIAVGKNLIAKGKFSQEVLARGTRQAAPGTASVDRAISTNMAARHERRIGGTVAEINAIAGNNGIEVLTLSPDKVINRYMQANGAISAQDFLLMGMRTGVIRAVKAQPGKSVEYLAAQEGLVPLFTRPSVVRDYDVLFGGTAQDWAGAGVTPQDLVKIQANIKAWYSGIKKGEKLKDISPFASLLHDVPVVQQAMNIEEALLDVRVFQFKQGQALFDIPTTHQQLLAAGVPPEKAWEAVATEFNKLAAQADSDIRVTGDMLNTWFDSGATSWRLYVPGQVAQSMIDIMDFASYASEGWAGSGFKRFMDAISNHYKTWFTVTNMAHHVGNALGNIFNNALDLGVYGALNPKTNIMATRLATAAAYVEEYGTLMKAAQALEAAKHPLESAADFALRKARLATFKATGMDELLFKGIDLGDGIVREADTAMRMLQEQGVLSGGHAQYIDINHVEEEMAEVLRLANDSETYTKFRKTRQNVRDAIILMLPVAYSGTLTSLGIVIPPRIGRMIAKATETQARLANFIGNMRRTGSVEQSAQHVNKFLFNYSDLSAVQKVWLRSIFPFFTWTFKNAYLQAQMALENPAFFNRFSQTLLFHAPKLVEAYERDIAFEGRFPAHPSKDYSIRWRLPHARFRLRIPVPEKPTLFLEGFRTPLESAAETYAQVGDLVTGLPGLPMAIMGMSGETAVTPPMDKYRLLSQVHFAARFLFEYAFQHNIYYNRPLSQLDNAKPIGQTLDALQNIYTKGVPVLSPMAGFLHNGMVMMSGFGVTPRVNRYTGALEEVPTASPGFTHFFMSMSFAQMLRKVMAVSDVYQTSMAEAGMINETVRDLYTVPYPVRYFDALTGIGLAQEDPLTRIKLVERDARDMQLRAMEAGGGVLTFQKPFIPKQ